MSTESIQRQQLEELRKEKNNLSRTPSPASVSSEGKPKRTARKSTHANRNSADTISSITKEEDTNSTASDTSRASEQDEIRKIILGLEKDGDISSSSKDVNDSQPANLGDSNTENVQDANHGFSKGSAESLSVKPFLFSVAESLFKNSSNDNGTKKDPLHEQIGRTSTEHSEEINDLNFVDKDVIPLDDESTDKSTNEVIKSDEALLDKEDFLEKKENKQDESILQLEENTMDFEDGKSKEEGITKTGELAADGTMGDSKKLSDQKKEKKGTGDSLDTILSDEDTREENEETKDEKANGDGSEKDKIGNVDDVHFKKLWENIQKDLTCVKDVESVDAGEEKGQDFEELPLGEALPHPQEEPSDWEDWEETSDHEQVENVEEGETKQVPSGECVLLSSDDDNSREAKEKAAVKQSDENPEDSANKEESRPPSEGDDSSCGERLRLSDISDAEFLSPVKADKESDVPVAETNEDDTLSEAKMTEDAKIEEEMDQPKEDEGVEELKEEDDLTILDEKRGEKRTSDEANTSTFLPEVEVKKVKLDPIPKEEEEEEIKDVTLAEDKPSPNILSKKILEELISRKIKDFMVEGNRNAFSALKDRCDALEKSVERWKFRAQHLQNQLNELVLEQKRYNVRKAKVSTRTVGINVRMVQVQTPVTASPGASVKLLPGPPPLEAQGKTSNKTPTTRSGPVPCHLVANMASPTKSTSVTASKTTVATAPTTAAATSVKIIDLTQDEESLQKSIAASLPPGTVVRPALTLQSPPVVSLPMVQGSSMVQLISSAGQPLTTGTRLPSTPTVPPGARVTYFVPNTIAGPRQLVAIPQQNISLPSPRGPMQTILLRMNAVPQSGSGSAQFITSSPANTTLSLVSTSAPSKVAAPAPKPLVVTTTASTTTVNTITISQSPVTPVISCLQKHPAPLPPAPVYPEDSKQKSPPPMPVLKISRVAQGIVLSWNMTVHVNHAEISVYQLYAYQETAGPPSSSLWKKVGDVRALPLPMACTLTQFVQGHKYHFAVRALDTLNRLGPFSEPASIILHTK